jgi:hypothetical protein
MRRRKYRSAADAAVIVAILASILASCHNLRQSWAAASTPGTTTSPFPHEAQPTRRVFRPISAVSIPDASIDAHIPRNAEPTDRRIVRDVMTMLPSRLRQFIVWFHVPPGKPGYESLPNHGLIVMLYKTGDKPDLSANPDGSYVLYFDGRVQPHSNLIYESSLDSYLTVVPNDWQWSFCSPKGQVGLTCSRGAAP